MARAQGRRKHGDRQSLCHSASRPRGRPRNMPPAIWRASKRHASVRRHACARALCPALSRKPPAPISPRSSARPASAPPMASFTASRASTTTRLLPRKLHARLELRDFDRALCFPSLAHSLRKAAFGYSMDDAGAHAFPPVAARRQGPLRLRRRRRTDGADHACLPRLAFCPATLDGCATCGRA